MIRERKNVFGLFAILIVLFFFSTSCSSIPLIGKKKEKPEKETVSEGKTVKIEGMEKIKGTNPPKAATPPPSQKPSAPANIPKKEPESKVASVPTKPFYSPPLPLFQLGFKKKVVILDFENKTTYQDEKIGEVAAKRLTDKLEATQRVVIMDRTMVAERLKTEGIKDENLTELQAMKHAHQSAGIQAFIFGKVTDTSLLSSKASESSDEEVAFATAKIEIRLFDASTGNLFKTFIGRSPIFGTKETGEYSRSKAVLKAIDFSLDEISEGLLRQLDLFEWTTSIAKIEGESLYINAGKLSGLRIGDTLEIYEPGKEIIHPTTNLSLGWTTGQLKGAIRITELFGVDAAVGKVVQGQGFDQKDVVKAVAK